MLHSRHEDKVYTEQTEVVMGSCLNLHDHILYSYIVLCIIVLYEREYFMVKIFFIVIEDTIEYKLFL